MKARWCIVFGLAGCDQVFSLDRDFDAPTIDTPTLDVAGACTLRKQPPIDVGRPLSGIAVGQFTADSNIDLVVASPVIGTVSVVPGNGDGTFDDSSAYTSSGSNPQGLAVADIDQDGDDDVVVANKGSDTVGLLYSRRPGFTSLNAMTGVSPSAVAVGVLHTGSRPDFAVANEMSGWFGAHFAPGFLEQALSAPGNPRAVAIADLDASFFGDVIGATLDGRARIFLSNASGGFSANPGTFVITQNPTAIASGTFDAGGSIDLAFSNTMLDQVQVFYNDGNGSFTSQPTIISVGTDPVAMIAVDITQDGEIDLITANAGTDNVSVLASTMAGDFTRNDFPAGATPSGLVSADFDRDGRPDLAIANGAAGTVTVLLNVCTP